MNFISISVFGIFSLFPNLISCENSAYVDLSESETATALTDEDFDNAKTSTDLGEEYDPSKTLREDLLEGDIVGLTESNIKSFAAESAAASDATISHSAIKNRYNLWPDKTIPYQISSRFTSRGRSILAGVIQEFQSRTCLKFVPRTNQKDYIYFKPLSGCYSYIGRSGGEQPISLGSGCFQKGTVIHEIMHGIGFFHEQNRADRDSYVKVYLDNVVSGMEHNFNKRSLDIIDHLGTTYDYSSVMHYGRKGFSKNGKPTLVPLKSHVEIGQRTGFSNTDLNRINKLYSCTDTTKTKKVTGKTTKRPLRTTKAPTTSNPGSGAVCYSPIPTNGKILTVKEGCYKILKEDDTYIVAYCSYDGNGFFTMTDVISFAKSAEEEAKEKGLERCDGSGVTIPETSTETGSSLIDQSISEWLERFLGEFSDDNSDSSIFTITELKK